MAFAPEGTTEAAPKAPAGLQPLKRQRVLLWVGFVGLAASAALGVAAILQTYSVRASAGDPELGRVSIESEPAGAAVIVDGTARGVTPLALSLDPGPHSLAVRGETDERIVDLNVTAGADISRSFELKASSGRRGRLSVVTDPPGLRVSIDGRRVGTSPLTVPNLTASNHRVRVAGDQLTAERTVNVEPDAVTSVVFSRAQARSSNAGWISVQAPFDVQVFENNEMIGTGQMGRVMLTPGPHTIEIVNRALGYSEIRSVVVSPGALTAVSLDTPHAMVNANAHPWADLSIDGNSVGQTPIGNLRLPIGTHEFVFRHPQLGERRQKVTVSLNAPNRIAVDLTEVDRTK